MQRLQVELSVRLEVYWTIADWNFGVRGRLLDSASPARTKAGGVTDGRACVLGPEVGAH